MKKSFLRRKVLPVVLSASMVVSFAMPIMADDVTTDASGETETVDAEDAALILTDSYEWTGVDSDNDGTYDYYQITGVVYETVVTNESYQSFNIYAPASYFNEDGTINYETEVNGYTADTAPIVLANNNAGWKSGSAGNVDTDYMEEGYVYVNCGSRSRDAEYTDEDGNTINSGKAPTAVVDLKSAVRYLRLNADSIPGSTDRIVSIGSSGGGQMSSILGASGNMEEYYSYLYEVGAAGIDYDEETGEYTSTIDDDVFAAMCYCPITDIDNADLAYAWWFYDSEDQNTSYTEFQLALQEDLAQAFCEYINELGVTNEDGEVLTFDENEDGTLNTRSGSYYDQVLTNISDSLNAFIENTEWPYTVTSSSLGGFPSGDLPDDLSDLGDLGTLPFSLSDAETSDDTDDGTIDEETTDEETTDDGTTYETFADYAADNYTDTENWLVENEDGTYSVTDMAGFIAGTGLSRFKDIPGFDTFNLTEEADAFGTSDEEASHFSASVAAVLEENYDYYSTLDGFSDADVDDFIEQAADEYVQTQTYLMNSTQIMLGVANGTEESDIAQYWRTRNGTADPHTSFTIAYNLAMAANAAGADVDYSLVWEMGHGADEGETTGTFTEWVNEIVAEADAAEAEAAAIEKATGDTDATNYTESIDNTTIDATTYLDYSNGIDEGVYEWVLSEDGTYYYLAQTADNSQYVYTSANITNDTYQSMMICVPAGYMTTDEDGNIVIDETAEINGYTAETAPIVFQNNCAGWNSSTPGYGSVGEEDPIEYGFIYVGCGARSRNASVTTTDEDGNETTTYTGKTPTPVVDLKAGVIELKANDDVIPGNKDQIISYGMSGAGQMSSILGASGNMSEYYSYMYETGVLGVTYDEDTDTYSSIYDDSVYAAQTFSAIADIENADLAYAWLWYDLNDAGGSTYTEMGASEGATLTEFQLALQQDEAEAFVDYINEMGLTDEDGNALTIDPVTEEDGTVNLHNGSYYDAVLQNLSDSLNAQVANGGDIVDRNGDTMSDEDIASFATLNEDGTYSVTDLAAYMIATGTVNARNKNVPGFDTLSEDAENNAFGTSDTYSVHYSRSVAQVLKDNLESYESLDGYEEQAENVANYIAILEDTDENNAVEEQTNLMNATEILLGSDGYTAVTPAKYWRVRSGAVDEHTSFTISFNLALAAQMNENVADVDYGQMWGVGHSTSEGTSLGTFVEWVEEITSAAAQEEETAETPAAAQEEETAETPAVEASDETVDTTTIKGVTYQILNKDKGTAKVIKIAKSKKKVTIKNSVKIGGNTYKVTVIAKNAAKNNKKLTKVTIGKNVTKIAANAFKGDKKLKTVIIKSKKLKSVGRNAFKNTAKKITIKSPKAKKAKYKKLIKKKTGISKKAIYK